MPSFMTYSYVEKMQNQVRERMEDLSSYQADKHFQFLSKNSPRIYETTLYSLIPYKDEREGFRLYDYLTDTIGFLNKKSSDCCSAYKHMRAGLTYFGFEKLLTIKRVSKNGDKYVKASMAHRVLFNYMVEKRLENFAIDQDIYTRADHIIGILMLLECLKYSSKCGSQINRRDEYKISSLLRSKLIKNSPRMYNNYFFTPSEIVQRKTYRQAQPFIYLKTSQTYHNDFFNDHILSNFSNIKNTWRNVEERNSEYKISSSRINSKISAASTNLNSRRSSFDRGSHLNGPSSSRFY